MLRNQTTALLRYEHLTTTVARAGSTDTLGMLTSLASQRSKSER